MLCAEVYLRYMRGVLMSRERREFSQCIMLADVINGMQTILLLIPRL